MCAQQLQASPADELKYVYLVEASGCASLPEPRALTGFQIEGVDGIVTALHGVVGCTSVSARQPESGRWFTQLQKRLVDIDRDVTVLSVPGLPAGGLRRHPPGAPADDRVVVLGHPSAMPGVWDMQLQLSERSLRQLSNVLPPGLFPAAAKRGSPGVEVRVLALNGDLQPGHSGAPVLDATRRQVLGVASGGLSGGTVGIGWAIPLSEITWLPATELERRRPDLAGLEPTDVFAHRDPDQPAKKPVERSRGLACLPQTMEFDLDRGDSHPSTADADLFLNAYTFSERYLQPSSSAAIAVIGDRDFDRVTPEALRRAPLSSTPLNASRDASNALPPGTVIAVRTTGGRYAKLQIVSSQTDAVSFNWVTFALPSEGPSPLAPNVEPCGAEGQLLCGTGQLPRDSISNFRLIERQANELIVALHHNQAPEHGPVWIGAFALDKDGAVLTPGFLPTAASPTGETVVRVNSADGRVRHLLFWMYELNKSEAFVCRRFDFR